MELSRKISVRKNTIERFFFAILTILIMITASGCGKSSEMADAMNKNEIGSEIVDVESSEDSSAYEAPVAVAGDGESSDKEENTGAPEETDSMEADSIESETSELKRVVARYEAGQLTLDELDDIRAELRLEAAKPYEGDILDCYRQIYDYNDRTIGYIHIDDTVIDGPVLQTLEDYEFYLHRDIDGNESEPGCIILDADSEIGIGTKLSGYLDEYEPSLIQLVHGHNMRNGTMFGSLLKYTDSDYGLAHNIICYDSIYEKREYELVEVLYSQIYPEESDAFKYYDIEGIDSKDELKDWLDNVNEIALYQTGVEANEDDEIIVLSTCSYHIDDGRFAIVGKRIK